MWSKRGSYAVKVVIPAFTVVVLINYWTITRLESERYRFTKRNVLTVKHNDHVTTDQLIHQDTTKRPFQFYIYDLPSSLNNDILNNFPDRKCFNFSSYGMGLEIYKTGNGDGSFSVYDTNQFNLEVIIHEKLKRNALQTRDPEKADLFYIPAYIGLLCIGDRQKVPDAIKRLKDFLTKSPYFSSGKPHFSTTSKIQKEMTSRLCPYLLEPFTYNITFISIEKQKISNAVNTIWPYTIMPKNSLILAPYPSYGHFIQSMETDLSIIPMNDRDVFILLPVGERPSNPQRSKLMDQFEIKTKLAYRMFKTCHTNGPTNMVLFYTNECSVEVTKYLIPWMQHSVFCLQPPGDSPSRKSFYDSIMSGCIPVILTDEEGHNPYAFQEFLDYDSFTISIEMYRITNEGHKIFNILQDVTKVKIQQMQDKIRQIAHYMQYSVPSGKVERENDALQLIFKLLSYKFNLKYDWNIEELY